MTGAEMNKRGIKERKIKTSRVRTAAAAVLCVLVMLLGGCGSGSIKDGYYTAEMAEYTNGWKEYVVIQVCNGNIVSAEFNAKNESGFIKAWDNSYMKNMITFQGITYPNRYTREYVQQLLEQQTDIRVDTVTGATSSGNNFVKLVDAVLKQAEKGDPETVVVE